MDSIETTKVETHKALAATAYGIAEDARVLQEDVLTALRVQGVDAQTIEVIDQTLTHIAKNRYWQGRYEALMASTR